jgi:hypothetical protein
MWCTTILANYTVLRRNRRWTLPSHKSLFNLCAFLVRTNRAESPVAFQGNRLSRFDFFRFAHISRESGLVAGF